MNKTLVAFLLALSFLPGSALAAPAKKKAAAQPPMSAETVNNPDSSTTFGPKASGPAVLRAQILLDRARFSPGEIDGVFGSNLEKAISAYQSVNSLPSTGRMDAETWTALNRDTAPALATYTISAADVAGPFVPIPKDMLEKANLTALGYTSAIEALGEKFHSSPHRLAGGGAGAPRARAGARAHAAAGLNCSA